MNKENFYGNKWIKCDLHIHTPFSNNTTYGDQKSEETWKNFISDIEKNYKEGSILGINDYNTFEGYFKIKNNYKDFFNNYNIFPVIELRTNDYVGKIPQQKINFHIIFSNELEDKDLECFLNYPLTSDDKRLLDSETPDVLVIREKIFDFFKKYSSLYKDKYLFMLGKNEFGDISKEIQPSYLKNISFICSASEEYLQVKKNQEYFQKYYPDTKYMHFSDSHIYSDNNSEKTRKIGHCFTWIRGIGNFETLRQAFYSYDTRVKLLEEKPIENIASISSIEFNFDSNVRLDNNDIFCFSGYNKILFNNSFNCIIGDRGVGKSTLINLINKKIDDNNETDTWYLSNIPKDKINIDYSENIDIFTQNTINEFVLDGSKLTEKLYKRFFDSLYSKEKENISKKEEKLQKCLERYNEIITFKNKIIENTNKICNLENKKSSLLKIINSINSEEYIDLNKNFKEIKEKINNIETDKKYFNYLYNSINQIIQESQKYINLKNSETVFNTATKEIVKELQNLISKYNEINNQDSGTDYNSKLLDIKKKIGEYLNKCGLDKLNIDNMQNIQNELITMENQLNILKKDNNYYKEQIDKFDFNKILFSVKRYENEFKKILKKINEKFAYSNIKEQENIRFEYTINFNNMLEDFSKKLSNIIKEKHLVEKDYSKFILSTLNKNLDLNKNSNKNINDKNNYLENLIDRIKNNNKESEIINKFFLLFKNNHDYEILHDYYNEIFFNYKKYLEIKIKFNNKDISECSFGQRCTAFLIVLLVLGNNPIIIDEPEAHIGQEAIFKTIVPIIQNVKYKRQIIFTTHNANIVVNGDADLILLLNNDNGITKIQPFSIDQNDNKKYILKLEGGEEAFKKREQKYNINNKK